MNLTDTTTEIQPEEIQPGDIVRFVPLGYRVHVTIKVATVSALGAEGRILSGYRARLVDRGERVECITRGHGSNWSTGRGCRTPVQLLRRLP